MLCHAVTLTFDPLTLNFCSRSDVTRSNSLPNYQCYVIKQARISLVSEIRDLGILIANKITVSQHISILLQRKLEQESA